MSDTLTRLRELPELAAECWMTWDAPNPGARSDGGSRRPAGSRPPTDLGAWDALRPDEKGLLEIIRSWTRLVVEDRADQGMTVPQPTDGWAGCCDYLITVASFWAGAEWRSEFETEVQRVHRALQVQARTPQPPRYRCDKCGATAHPQPGGQWMLCEAGHEVAGLGVVRDRLMSARPMTAQAMEREWGESLGLRADTIGSWGRRGWLTEKGRVLIDRKWRPVYEPWDVLRLLQRHAKGEDLAESG